MSWNPIPGPLVASPRRWGPRFSPAQLPVFGGGLTLTLFCYRFFSTWEDLGCPPVGRQGSAMKRAAMRLWTLNKGLLTHGRGLSQGSQYKISEPLHIHQGKQGVFILLCLHDEKSPFPFRGAQHDSLAIMKHPC